jgi:hypothetical protein
MRTGIIVKSHIMSLLNLETNDVRYLRYFLNKIILYNA